MTENQDGVTPDGPGLDQSLESRIADLLDKKLGLIEERVTQISSAHEDFARKTNKELKRARLRLRDGADEDDASESSPVAQGSDAQLKQLRELARLETKLPEKTLAALIEQTEGMTVSETLRVYQVVASALPSQGGTPDQAADPSQPSPPKPTGARGQGPQHPPSSAVAYPKTQYAFARLSKEKRDALMKDSNFRLEELPRISRDDVFEG